MRGAQRTFAEGPGYRTEGRINCCKSNETDLADSTESTRLAHGSGRIRPAQRRMAGYESAAKRLPANT